MGFVLGRGSRKKLTGVHPDLVRVVERAIEITDTDFAVIEGLRSPERQRELVAAGASKTLRSRHLTGHAVDLAVDGIDREHGAVGLAALPASRARHAGGGDCGRRAAGVGR